MVLRISQPDTHHLCSGSLHRRCGRDVSELLGGPDKDGCYAGMLERQLIDPVCPAASVLASPRFSPIAWINPLGTMPRDGTRPFPPGGSAMIARDEIIAWANACAQLSRPPRPRSAINVGP